LITKSFNILAISLNVQHNYFDSQTKLSLDLYQAKFTYTLAKPFFPCRYNSNELRFNG